ncbi:hypothetical protein VP01_1639g5 [Puccinia sorghi]|uniref:Uncharacterized protein n=1 Tax=Puccinia sorghi TaxID=27349 RepID=A0A0L6VGR3_9BASI|nr:hypothetical protein VP01_1639g5 [Puccinia sorghi]
MLQYHADIESENLSLHKHLKFSTHLLVEVPFRTPIELTSSRREVTNSRDTEVNGLCCQYFLIPSDLRTLLSNTTMIISGLIGTNKPGDNKALLIGRKILERVKKAKVWLHMRVKQEECIKKGFFSCVRLVVAYSTGVHVKLLVCCLCPVEDCLTTLAHFFTYNFHITKYSNKIQDYENLLLPFYHSQNCGSETIFKRIKPKISMNSPPACDALSQLIIGWTFCSNKVSEHLVKSLIGNVCPTSGCCKQLVGRAHFLDKLLTRRSTSRRSSCSYGYFPRYNLFSHCKFTRQDFQEAPPLQLHSLDLVAPVQGFSLKQKQKILQGSLPSNESSPGFCAIFVASEAMSMIFCFGHSEPFFVRSSVLLSFFFFCLGISSYPHISLHMSDLKFMILVFKKEANFKIVHMTFNTAFNPFKNEILMIFSWSLDLRSQSELGYCFAFGIIGNPRGHALNLAYMFLDFVIRFIPTLESVCAVMMMSLEMKQFSYSCWVCFNASDCNSAKKEKKKKKNINGYVNRFRCPLGPNLRIRFPTGSLLHRRSQTLTLTNNCKDGVGSGLILLHKSSVGLRLSKI